MYERVCPAYPNQLLAQTYCGNSATLIDLIINQSSWKSGQGWLLFSVGPYPWPDGQVWQFPAGTADCQENAHAAIPALFVPGHCSCAADHQTPTGFAQKGRDSAHALLPASAP